jgi:hypothetical protein
MALRARTFVEERFDWSVIGRRQLEAWGLDAEVGARRSGTGGDGRDKGPGTEPERGRGDGSGEGDASLADEAPGPRGAVAGIR